MIADGPALDAALYDWDCTQFLRRQLRDVEFYNRELPGRLLELACGTGRVTAGLVARGRAVTGLDINPHMLARAEQRLGPAVPLVCGDMRTFSLNERFDGVLLAYNSFQVLHDSAEQLRCLAQIRDHLAPGGRLALEITPFQLRDPASDWAYRAEGPLEPKSDVVVVAFERVRQEPALQLTHYDVRYQLSSPSGWNSERISTLTLRTVYRYEMQLLLERVGFQVQSVAGDYDGVSLEECPNEGMLFVAKSN